jgi:16S rRNA G527 N7-methylase RsmG
LSRLELQDRARVVAERFERTPAPEADAVTCRALERFTEMYAKLAEWSPPRATLLLFGGALLREEIERTGRASNSVLIPESERRFLFIVETAERNL